MVWAERREDAGGDERGMRPSRMIRSMRASCHGKAR